jgi:hypothetical protein
MQIIKEGRIPIRNWWIGKVIRCAYCGQKIILEKCDRWRVEEYTLQSLKGRATYVINISCCRCFNKIFFTLKK